jgi:hypothetical protein
MQNKTLIGKNNYLFLQNDTCRELEVHCNNLNLVTDTSLSRYNFKNFLITIFPNKSYIYSKFLPDGYNVNYRPAFQIYKNKFDEKIIDGYAELSDQENIYYKTDTHINLKGNYIIYKKFIEKVNNLYNLNLVAKHINIHSKVCKLNTLPYGVGDLTYPVNLGDQTLDDINDIYFYSDDITDFYCIYKINNEENIRFLDYNLVDNTSILEKDNKNIDWVVISKYIIYKKNTHNNTSCKKIIIFYDSFLLNIISLYFELFDECNVYFIKSIYENALINLIKPDYIFEFRLERFLN